VVGSDGIDCAVLQTHDYGLAVAFGAQRRRQFGPAELCLQ